MKIKSLRGLASAVLVGSISLPVLGDNMTVRLDEGYQDALKRITQSVSSLEELSHKSRSSNNPAIDGQSEFTFGEAYSQGEICVKAVMHELADVFTTCFDEAVIEDNSVEFKGQYYQDLVEGFRNNASDYTDEKSIAGFKPFTVFQNIVHPTDGSSQKAGLSYSFEGSVCIDYAVESVEFEQNKDGFYSLKMEQSGTLCL